MIKECLIKCLNIIVIIVFGAIIAAIFMFMAFIVPVNSDIAADAINLLDKEGWYPLASVQSQEYETYFHSYEPDVLDNSSDKIMISTALDQAAEGNVAVRAMNAYSEYMGKSYSYYWHGYSIILRPFMLFLDLTDVRGINSIAQIVLVFFLAKILWDKKGVQYAVMILSSYVLLHPVALGKSLQFSWVFYIGIIGSIIAVRYLERLEIKNRYVYLFAVVGMATSFFDLLTYPLFTWGMVMVVFLLVSVEGQSALRYLFKVIGSGVAWITGYAGMWIMKWIIGSFLTQTNIFESALFEVMFRVGVESNAEVEIFSIADRIEVLYQNWKHYDNEVFAIILIAWVIWTVVMSVKKGISKSAKVPALLLTGLSSFVWYMMIANHTSIHHFFTYRIYAVSILAFMAIALICTDTKEPQTWKNGFRMLGGWVGLGIVSIFIVVTYVKEAVDVNNGSFVSRYILLEPEGCIEAEFIPTFSGINEFLLCTRSESTEGYYRVSIFQDGKEVYLEQYSMSEFVKSSFRKFEVKWDVKAGEHYDIVIEAVDANADVFAVITEEGNMPLAEYRNLQVNGENYASQPSTGFTYWCMPPSDLTKMLMVAVTMGMLACVMLTIVSVLPCKFQNIN